MQIFFYSKGDPSLEHVIRRRYFLNLLTQTKIPILTNVSVHGGVSEVYTINKADKDERQYFFGADMVFIEHQNDDPNVYNIMRAAKLLEIPVFIFVTNPLLALPEAAYKRVYTNENLYEIFTHILENIHEFRKEKHKIKFTLRISPSIERFIEKMSKQIGESKADYVRSLIEKEMKDKI